jgi:hypothetical protein
MSVLAKKSVGTCEAESWLQDHDRLAATVVLLLGLLARLWAASGTFLNPDEALHFRLANQLSLALAYNESLTASHPPLLTVILYFWRAFGTSELWLRLPSVFAGVVFGWMFYKWMSQAAGRLAGLIGLLFVAFLPPIVLLSAEIRQYALLLAFLAGALHFLDDALAKKSIGGMLAFSVCLDLAMLSHYSAFLFAGALGIYALVKIFAGCIPAGLTTAWVVGQLGALALAVLLYKTHLAKLGAGESRTVLQGWMSEFFLRRSYFEPGRDHPLLFVISRSFGVFQFVFGQLAVGDLAGLLFIAALVFLTRERGQQTDIPSAAPRQLALFLVLAFAFACGASLAHYYPYGGTRHSAMLVIPAVAGVSIAVAQLARGLWNRGIAVAALIVVLCVVFGKQHQPYVQRAEQSRIHMIAAIDWIRQNAKPSDVVFTDYESELILGHYLCRQRPITFEESNPDFEVFPCDGVRVVSASYRTATLFDARSFISSWNRLVQTDSLKEGTSVWIFQAGWNVDLAEDLRSHFAEFRNIRVESFGRNIKIFKLTVGQPVPAITTTAPQFRAGRFSPNARKVISSGTLRPFFFVTTPKLPE